MHRLPRLAKLPALACALSLALAGCGGSSTMSTQFAASTTPAAPGLVKLVLASNSDSTVLVDAILFGPLPDADLYAFDFAVKIGEPNLVRLAPQTNYVQTALVSDDGQPITIGVTVAADPSLVHVHVEKTNGSAGNGIAAQAALVIQLPFQVSGSGASTLALTGNGNNPATAFDSRRMPIAAITFDAASANVLGTQSGGGY